MPWTIDSVTWNTNSSNDGLILSLTDSNFPSDRDPDLTVVQIVISDNGSGREPDDNDFPDDIRWYSWNAKLKIGTDRGNIDINDRLTNSSYDFSHSNSGHAYNRQFTLSYWTNTGTTPQDIEANLGNLDSIESQWKNYRLMGSPNVSGYVRMYAFSVNQVGNMSWEQSSVGTSTINGLWNTANFGAATTYGAGAAGDPHINTFDNDNYNL